MVLDSSAVIAIVMAEPGHQNLLAKIRSAASAAIPSPAVVELVVVLSHRLAGDPIPLLIDLLTELKVEIIPFTEDHSFAAMRAFMRFGKGRHPAALNYGGCLVYAVASALNQPLLYVGNDYARTDLIPA